MKHVIGTIRNTGHPVDIFVNLKSHDNPLNVGRGATNANHTVLKSILASVVKPVVEHHLALDDNMIPEHATPVEDNTHLFNKPSFCNGTEYYGVIARPQILYRFHQCMRLIEQYEVDYSVKYPFVYMLRPDIWINGSVYLPDFLGKRENRNTLFTNMSPRGISEPFRYWYSLAFPKVDIDKTIPFSGDFLIAGTRNVIDIATKAHTSVDTCDPYQFQGHLGPEMNLLRWMLKNNVSVDSEPIPICVARGTGPECFLFETFPKLNEAKAMEMADNCRLKEVELGRQQEEMVG